MGVCYIKPILPPHSASQLLNCTDTISFALNLSRASPNMASKPTIAAVLLLFNLLFSSVVSANHVPCPPPPPATASCPRDTLKLGVCADLLNDLVHVVVGTPPKTPCCSLIKGLADLEAAVCLCTAIKANILGINLNVPVSLSLLLNYCGKDVPKGFQCA